ncbi:hypothetical protein DXG03_001710 [Asterophora parasitica]|uniref:PH domain-containing protein n=1 Tax=Asterophora parasitica TaxID=117018 RepID=A0A9P7GBU1_9AGAR|nr:hypothetical protein DXG03_001710 [Asterophora parasitica]
MTRTTSAQSPLSRAPEANNQPQGQLQAQAQHQGGPPGAPSPLHPEIRSVVQLTAAHAHKIYFSGPLVRRIERQPDGQRPAKDEGWCEVWAQLGGTTLSIWDMAQIQEASKQGREVPPTYVNTTDAFVQVLGSLTTPETPTIPSKKYTNVLTLNTAGSNLLLFSCPSTSALMSWAAALRLSAWEKSRLEEIYTAHLIRITLNAPNAPSTLARGRMEGWVRIRIAGQTDWKRMWMSVAVGAEGGAGERLGVGGPSASAASLPKKKRMSNLFSRDTAPQQPALAQKPLISMFAGPKPKDKKRSLLTIKDVTQAFAVYPERPELISRSTLIKVEGTFGDEDTAAVMKSREGWLLVMPELEGGLGQAAEMLKWVVAVHDAFELYGRPEAWTWDPRDPISLMFAYPVGPNKDVCLLAMEDPISLTNVALQLLFLDRELAETLDPRDERTSSIRSRLIGILLDRIRRPEVQPPRIVSPSKAPILPPIGGNITNNTPPPQQQQGPGLQTPSNNGGPQLPPLSFGNGGTPPSEHAAAPEGQQHQAKPITERSSAQTNGRSGTGEVSSTSPYTLPHPGEQGQYVGQDKSLPEPQEEETILFNRLSNSPGPISPQQSVSIHGSDPQTRSPSIQNAVPGGPAHRTRTSDSSNINRGFQVQSRVDSGTSSASHVSRPYGDGMNGAVNPTAGKSLSPMSDQRMAFSPPPPAQNQAAAQSTSPVPSSPPSSYSAPIGAPTNVLRSTSVLTSPHSAVGHDHEDDSQRQMPDHASVLTSPHSPSLHPHTLTSPYSPQGTLRSLGGTSSRMSSQTAASSQQPKLEDSSSNLFNEAGALYYMQLDSSGNNTQNQQRRLPPTAISEHDDDEDDEDDSSSSYHGSTQHPSRQSGAVSPTSNDSAHENPPIRQSTPMAFFERSSPQTTSATKPANRVSPSRQGLGRKPSGARAQATRTYNGSETISSHQVTEEEETDTSEEQDDRPQTQMNQLQAHPSTSSEDPNLDALAALSYLAVDDRPASPQANVQPLNISKAPSPPPVASGAESPAPFKSSFAPSNKAAERKAKAQAQQAAHHAATHKPGRANGKRKSKIAGAWNESSDEEEEEEEEDDDDDDVDSDAEPVVNRQGQGFASSTTSLRQGPNTSGELPSEPNQQQYSHLRPPRTLPQIPEQNYPDEYNPPPRRIPSDQYPGGPSPRFNHDGTPIRTQAEFPQMPGAARQSVWSQVLDPGRAANVEAPRNDKFVQLEPAESMTKAFTPQGLLSAGIQDKQDRSAKRQEELARETGASLINVPNKPPPPQMGLLGAITAHERERKRDGGVGAALTEREREKRVAEDRQRRFDEHQRQQLDQMQQGGSMYGGQFPGYGMNPMMMMNPMMGMNPMMTGGGLSPMMTGNPMMGYPGMMPGYNPQHMFAAQQAAQAYQQAMMAFSVAGSQVGGEGGGGTPPLNPAMTGGTMGGNMSMYDPRMSMMMPMMGQMGPMGMQMTGMSTFDPRFPPNASPGSMNDAGLAPPTTFAGQGHLNSMGVKSLWSLLTPVGRPVLLETIEGKVMAIDSSIWIYQFQATMRDKDGRALTNAHVVGFLRRIAKLLFYGIKPVFVFDGGAPTLKTSTLRGRREKKSGAAASHAKIAEKLLAAKMRREALNQADYSQGVTSKGKEKQASSSLDDGTVYLEDVETTLAKTPAKKKVATPSSSTKKAKFYDHDPYRLPEVDLEAEVAKATRTAAPDPRLATEDELRAFIDDMRPEDFDVTSPAFRDLPTEVQYEIVGDLRLKSRQTSYARLQNMLRNAPTPLDFSKQQIKNLRQRNTLTQQLLITTDTIGSAHISIPVRIASERNKEYVLMKNEGESGGWILGIRDNSGTQDKPIEIDHEREEVVDEDSEEDMEEVPISVPAAPDPDLSQYQRTMALSAIGKRHSALSNPIHRKTKSGPLFESDDEDGMEHVLPTYSPELSDIEDDMLAIAVQESLEQSQLTNNIPQTGYSPALGEPSSSKMTLNASTAPPNTIASPSQDDNDFVFESPSRLETALSIANAGPSRPHLYPAPPSQMSSSSSIFGRPTLLTAPSKPQLPSVRVSRSAEKSRQVVQDRTVLPLPSPEPPTNLPTLAETRHVDKDEARVSTPETVLIVSPIPTRATNIPEPQISSDEDMEEAIPVPTHAPDMDTGVDVSPETISMEEVAPAAPSREIVSIPIDDAFDTLPSPVPIAADDTMLGNPPLPGRRTPSPIAVRPADKPSSSVPLFAPSPKDDEEELIPWSRSPSPTHELPTHTTLNPPHSPIPEDEWNTAEMDDAVEEMDPQAEEGEYARFISQVKGKNIDDVRAEIDEEIKHLHQQRKAAMRDSEDITMQMISQIMAMLRLFGIPYITAPMEAEAQCAELVTLGLVDGVITDDSDVFLFGAQRVFKNMFNQSKTVECFLLSDLARDLGLERDTLVRLAYLLGSDYTEGLSGVGPVVAMELLKEFPGDGGLVRFREWWVKVQTGKDREEDNKSKFRKQFKKKYKDLFLTDDWPNPAVHDAYYHPTVDSSDEPFKWGMPDLDALRLFFREELGWGQTKVDEILLPIIQKINKRGQAAALNKQSNLSNFFDMSAGSGTYAPKKRQVYASKRLQNVVDDFRKSTKRARGSVALASGSGSRSGQSDSDEDFDSTPAKKRKKVGNGNGKGKSRAAASFSGKGRGKTATAQAPAKGQRRARAKKKPSSDDDFQVEDVSDPEATLVEIPPDPVVAARLRPRPKPRPKRKMQYESPNQEGGSAADGSGAREADADAE